MTVTTNKRTRFANNNLATSVSDSNISFTSEQANFPFSNSKLDERYKFYKFAGNFTITTTNQILYLDGAYVVNISLGNYTADTLSTEITAKLVSAGDAGGYCTYSATTRKFTLNTTIGMDIQEKTNAIWDTLGFLGISPVFGVAIADEPRNHTHESIVWDFSVPRPIDFFAMLCPLGETITFSETATVTLKGSNVNDFTSPAITITPVRNKSGYFYFENEVISSYRYWEFKIIDKLNTVGGGGFEISYIYLGDYLDFSVNISDGIGKAVTDLTTIKKSDAGAPFFRLKTKFTNFNGLNIVRISKSQRDEFEAFFDEFGLHKAFIVSIDPTLAITDKFDDLTKFVRFSGSPSYKHEINDLFTVSFSLNEVF